MSRVQSPESKVKELNDENLFVVDGELLEESETAQNNLEKTENRKSKTKDK